MAVCGGGVVLPNYALLSEVELLNKRPNDVLSEIELLTIGIKSC